jgi:hypothetical protein
MNGFISFHQRTAGEMLSVRVLKITEFDRLTRDARGDVMQVARLQPIAEQDVTLGSSTQSNTVQLQDAVHSRLERRRYWKKGASRRMRRSPIRTFSARLTPALTRSTMNSGLPGTFPNCANAP